MGDSGEVNGEEICAISLFAVFGVVNVRKNDWKVTTGPFPKRNHS